MHKIFLRFLFIIIIIFIALLVFLSTKGVKTNNFNSLIIQKVNEINPKIKLTLEEVSFKFKPLNFKFEVSTYNSEIALNQKKIDLEFIKSDFIPFEYFKKRSPFSQISVLSKENDINQFIDFINEYEFNLARSIMLKQIKKGTIIISSEIIIDQENPKQINYSINGKVRDAEINLINQLKVDDLQFEFSIDDRFVNLKKLKLKFDQISIYSENLNIKKVNNNFEIEGDLKSKKSKINLINYLNLIRINSEFLKNEYINVSSDNNFSFKINNNFKVDDLNITSIFKFDELHTKSVYQDLIYLKNGIAKINYKIKDLYIELDSKFQFKNNKYNKDYSNNLIKINYSKLQNSNAKVKIDLSNKKNKINTIEFRKLLSFKNFNLPDQDIFFSSDSIIQFDLNKKNKIQNLNFKSKIKNDFITVEYNSKRIKKYFNNFKNQFNLSESDININYDENIFQFNLNSKYAIEEEKENLSLSLIKKDSGLKFDLDVDLKEADILIKELNYKKKPNINSNLHVEGIYKKNKEIFFKNIKFSEDEKNLIIENLEISKNDKIKNLDRAKINLNNIFQIKNEIELKKVNGNYYLTGSEFDGTSTIKNLLDNSSKSIFSYFKNLNTNIYLDIGKYYINKNSYLSNIKGDIAIKKNKIIKSNIKSKLNNESKFELMIFINKKNQKMTKLEIDRPEPFIKNFKFIKGFKEGSFTFNSKEFEGKAISNIKIKDFKVQEVPVLAKLLTLASLQGIADLLTGEGIRFTDFEMDYETLGNATNINEMYAIGPAISLMMEGYVVKDNLISLKGTLVPATTVNRTISKIPMLGEILVGKKIGEGVFGVSFKIKGPPKKLKTTVNPIKTLTPRFITRTLEKISN